MKPLTVLYLGNFRQEHATEGYIGDALARLGVDVLRIQEDSDDPQSMYCRVKSIRPDVLLFSKCELSGLPFKYSKENPEKLKMFLHRVQHLGVKTVCWVFDLMRESFSPTRYHWAIEVSKVCDAFYCTDSGLADDPEITNGRLLRQAYPDITVPDLYHHQRGIKTPKYEYNIAHLGEIYGDRRSWVRYLRNTLGARFGVIDTAIGDHELRNLAASCNIIAGPSYPFFPGYWSNRLYLVTGYGLCFACPTVEGMAEEGWIPGIHYIELKGDVSQQAATLSELGSDPSWYTRIAIQGQAFCRANHSFSHRAGKLKGYLEVLCGRQ